MPILEERAYFGMVDMPIGEYRAKGFSAFADSNSVRGSANDAIGYIGLSVVSFSLLQFQVARDLLTKSWQFRVVTHVGSRGARADSAEDSSAGW